MAEVGEKGLLRRSVQGERNGRMVIRNLEREKGGEREEREEGGEIVRVAYFLQH